MSTPTLARAQRFQLPSAHTGREYAISLYRPGPSPFTGAPADCPIVVVLDGAMTFGTAVESTELRAALGQLRPAVIVGVAHDTDLVTAMRLRSRDFTTPAPSGRPRLFDRPRLVVASASKPREARSFDVPATQRFGMMTSPGR